jgi:hypothetical protein
MIGKYTRTLQIRAERHARAVAVQEANKRTPQEQLAHLDKMGMVATKERAKIAKKLKSEAEAQKKGKK